MEYPLEKYRSFIEKVEKLPLFKKLSAKQRRLSKAKISDRAEPGSSRVIAEIARRGKDFSVRYSYEGFNRVYIICGNCRSKIPESSRLMYRMRRINSRNELTHKMLKGIIRHQGEYLTTSDSIDLVPFSQVELVKTLQVEPLRTLSPGGRGKGEGETRVDNTWISRLVNSISVIIPSGEERTLRSFFPTQKDINKKLIKQLLDKENEDIESGRLERPLTDNEIGRELERKYGLEISRHSINHCRKDMGIPPSIRRLSGYKYPPLSANFSVLYPLTVQSVQSNASASSGIYEFRLKGKEVEYPKGKTQVIYIGSSRNIKKRLREHLGRNSKNGHIRNFLRKYECSFRYILFKKDWQNEEKGLYRLFMDTYGSAPKCNRVRP